MDSARKGTVLFLPLSKANALEMMPIARSLKSKGMLTPLFCVISKRNDLLELLQSETMDAVRPDGTPLPRILEPHTSATNTTGGAQNTIALRVRLFNLLPAFLRSLWTLSKEQSRARSLIARHRDLRLIIVAGDRNIGIETALIAEAHRQHIPSLIVPFAMSFPEASAEPRLRGGKFMQKFGVHTPPRRFLRWLFPSWVYVHKGTPMFFHPVWTALAAWVLGIAPKKPWIIGGGSATLMAAESEAIRRDLLAQGMAPEKLIVTGKPGLDSIADQLRLMHGKDERRALGISREEQVILCSVPQLAEHDILPWDRHKQEMEFLFQTLTKTGARVLLSLHPKCDRSWYQPLADAAGAHIRDERIYQLLPICDLFVATYSSTVAQAIALCKPAVVVDFYDLEYPLYRNAPGVRIVRTHEELLPIMQSLLNEHSKKHECYESQKLHGNEWALLDGKNTDRVITEIEKLTASCG